MEALSIVALILSIMGVFTPLAGVFISGLSGLIALAACWHRNSYALAAIILNIINFFILSPQTLLTAFSSNEFQLFDMSGLKYALWCVLFIQCIGLFLYIKNKRIK